MNFFSGKKLVDVLGGLNKHGIKWSENGCPIIFHHLEEGGGRRMGGGEDRVVSGGTDGGSIGIIRGGPWKLTGNEWGGEVVRILRSLTVGIRKILL